jgi:hypothetical protein
MTVSSCTGEMKRVYDCKMMVPFHLSSKWVYSHVPVSFLQYMSLKSCSRFISPVHEFTVMYRFISAVHERVLKKWNGCMTVYSCTGEMKRIHDCRLVYWRNATNTWLNSCTGEMKRVHDWYRFHFFSTRVYSHVSVSFLQYISLQSCTRFISPVHEFSHVFVAFLQYTSLQSCIRCSEEIKRVHYFKFMYCRDETGTLL